MNLLKILSLFALIGFFTVSVGVNPLLAQSEDNKEQEVRALLEERDDEIKDLLGDEGSDYTEEQRSELKDIINDIIDYSAMAEFALQETYDTLSAEQRAEFIDLFSTIVRDQSMNQLDIYRADVTYESIEVDGNQARVETMATLEDSRTPVHYNMEYREEEQEWKIIDLAIDDVSTAESYQRQFQNILRKRGYDSLLETLQKRAERQSS